MEVEIVAQSLVFLETLQYLLVLQSRESKYNTNRQGQAQAPPRRRRRRKGETKAQEREEAERKAQAKAAEEAKEKARQAERARFEVWASRQRALLQDKHFDERGQLGNRQQDERLREDKLIKEHYQKGQEAQRARLQEIQANQSKGGVLYRMTRARAELADVLPTLPAFPCLALSIHPCSRISLSFTIRVSFV